LTYYHRRGPLGQAFARVPRLSTGLEMAVVGLGTGSAAAYAGESQRWTFFEIDPVVERIARDTRYFHFLETCGARCAVVLGDARLSLARSAKRFDAIILDAFSSDAIPVHLLTREAVDVYLQHLKPGGVLMFHISNRYLRLGPLIGLLAHDRGLAAVEQLQPTEAADVSAGWYASDWVVASSDRAAIDALASDPHWTPLAPAANARVWTDDYSNIVALLKPRSAN
jgi:SAM-dependent methyltransferase